MNWDAHKTLLAHPPRNCAHSLLPTICSGGPVKCTIAHTHATTLDCKSLLSLTHTCKHHARTHARTQSLNGQIDWSLNEFSN